MSPEPSEPRRGGRPRGYVPSEALEHAMRQFWRDGYDAASIGTLSRATRMPRATIYQRYSDKEGLFLAAVGHYAETRLAPVAARLNAGGSLAQDLLSFFLGAISLATEDPSMRGCLISCVLADAAGTNKRLREELGLLYERMEAKLERRFDTAQSMGELPPSVDTSGLALATASLARGLMLRARSGAKRHDLERAAQASLAILVGEKGPR